ncbi:MAG TPA: hypothetical protein VGK02_06655 [Candidatus Aquicultor sp.]|jgi:hypothetical protein
MLVAMYVVAISLIVFIAIGLVLTVGALLSARSNHQTATNDTKRLSHVRESAVMSGR